MSSNCPATSLSICNPRRPRVAGTRSVDALRSHHSAPGADSRQSRSVSCVSAALPGRLSSLNFGRRLPTQCAGLFRDGVRPTASRKPVSFRRAGTDPGGCFHFPWGVPPSGAGLPLSFPGPWVIPLFIALLPQSCGSSLLMTNMPRERFAVTEKSSFCSAEVPRGQSVSAALDVQGKLKVIAGPGKLEQKISEARARLARINSERWRSPLAPGRIRRFFYLAQKPEPEEVDDVRAAYRDFCDEKVKLAERILSSIEYASRTDPEMYQPHIEQLVAALDQIRPFLPGR